MGTNKPNNAKYKDKDYLYAEHWINNKSTHQIARENGVYQETIIWWMDKFNIQRRNNVEALRMMHKNKEILTGLD